MHYLQAQFERYCYPTLQCYLPVSYFSLTVTYICTLIIFPGENCITLNSDDMMKYNM